MSDAISKFIHGIDDKNGLEGAFVVAYANDEEVNTLLVEVVFNNHLMRDKIATASRDGLIKASVDTGIKIRVASIPIWTYTNKSINDYECPVKGMLKSGKIIYDVNGNLIRLQRRYKMSKCVNDLRNHDVVKMEPSVQYKKQN